MGYAERDTRGLGPIFLAHVAALGAKKINCSLSLLKSVTIVARLNHRETGGGGLAQRK